MWYKGEFINSYQDWELIFLDEHHAIFNGSNADAVDIFITDDTHFVYDGIEVVIDDEVRAWESLPDDPYYQMRGKPLTEEQTIDIISRTDGYFRYPFKSDNHVGTINFHIHWFDYTSPYGWVHPDGIIGLNDNATKYPDLEELLTEFLRYARAFPYLDLVVGITAWEGMPDKKREILYPGWIDTPPLFMVSKMKYDELKYMDCDEGEFLDNLEIGVWLHDKKVEIMSPARTAEVYREYSKKYTVDDTRVYYDAYYNDFQPDIITLDFLKKCLAKNGIRLDSTGGQSKAAKQKLEKFIEKLSGMEKTGK